MQCSRCLVLLHSTTKTAKLQCLQSVSKLWIIGDSEVFYLFFVVFRTKYVRTPIRNAASQLRTTPSMTFEITFYMIVIRAQPPASQMIFAQRTALQGRTKSVVVRFSKMATTVSVSRYLNPSAGMGMNTYGGVNMMTGAGMDGMHKTLLPSSQRRKRRVLFSQAQVLLVNWAKLKVWVCGWFQTGKGSKS